MIDHTGASSALALDSKGLSELRRLAGQHSPEALSAVARHFEALLINMMLKSMRDATSSGDLMDSEQSRMYTSIFDQQLSQSVASRGVGLADVLIQQLRSAAAGSPEPTMRTHVPSLTLPADGPVRADTPGTPQEFCRRLSAHAEEASRLTGIPAGFMIAHAALETGWGKHEIIGVDGTNSHNLFGIKAAGSWKGRVVESSTTEYSNGVAQTIVAKFRAYDSYADAFKDYAKLLRADPRYKEVVENVADARKFAESLQRSGYATDPSYADKLTRIIKQIVSS
jgi:flagellar protein FlgJ